MHANVDKNISSAINAPLSIIMNKIPYLGGYNSVIIHYIIRIIVNHQSISFFDKFIIFANSNSDPRI